MNRPEVLESKFRKYIQHETGPNLARNYDFSHVLTSRLCSFRTWKLNRFHPSLSTVAFRVICVWDKKGDGWNLRQVIGTKPLDVAVCNNMVSTFSEELLLWFLPRRRMLHEIAQVVDFHPSRGPTPSLMNVYVSLPSFAWVSATCNSRSKIVPGRSRCHQNSGNTSKY